MGLILIRKPNEKIRIGENVTVTVLEVIGRRVRISVDAPKDVAVDREEIWDKKQADKAAGII